MSALVPRAPLAETSYELAKGPSWHPICGGALIEWTCWSEVRCRCSTCGQRFLVQWAADGQSYTLIEESQKSTPC